MIGLQRRSQRRLPDSRPWLGARRAEHVRGHGVKADALAAVQGIAQGDLRTASTSAPTSASRPLSTAACATKHVPTQPYSNRSAVRMLNRFSAHAFGVTAGPTKSRSRRGRPGGAGR